MCISHIIQKSTLKLTVFAYGSTVNGVTAVGVNGFLCQQYYGFLTKKYDDGERGCY